MKQKRKILIFENTHTLTNYLLTLWLDTAQKHVRDKGNFTAALSGGSTPVEFYCKLSGVFRFDLWEKTHIFLTDERFVPLDSLDSNYAGIRQNLTDFVNIPPENLFYIDTECESPEDAASRYEKDIREFFKGQDSPVPGIDMVILGVGEDGHTASLFPGHKALLERERLAVGVSSDCVKFDRVSMTLPLINRAKDIVFLVTGGRKEDVVRGIFQKGEDLPAAMVTPDDGEMIFLLDKSAAKSLSVQEPYDFFDEAVVAYY